VTGYLGGSRNPLGDYWIVRQSDAHAWVEVCFPDAGWVRKDPTQALSPAQNASGGSVTAPDAFLGGCPALPLVHDLVRGE
ncbi:transglutaminase-like domain-containing protein, partial [Acinetobacter johnsonii]|uniref:transglutaminase-like domain-containing protein n=1 Tax=Acinetobacter johnsonii TaxID=40214 RepID=UPI001F164972